MFELSAIHFEFSAIPFEFSASPFEFSANSIWVFRQQCLSFPQSLFKFPQSAFESSANPFEFFVIKVWEERGHSYFWSNHLKKRWPSGCSLRNSLRNPVTRLNIFHGTVYETAFFFAWVILTRYLDEEARMIGEKQQQSGSQEKDSKETGEWSFFYC